MTILLNRYFLSAHNHLSFIQLSLSLLMRPLNAIRWTQPRFTRIQLIGCIDSQMLHSIHEYNTNAILRRKKLE